MSGSSPRCSVCAHRLRDEIDAALLMGEPRKKVARRFGIGRGSVLRHFSTHLQVRLAEEVAKLAPGEADGLMAKLLTAAQTLDRNIRKAEKVGQHSTVATLVKVKVEVAEKIARIRGELLPELKGAGGDTYNTAILVDADVGKRMAQAYLERHGHPLLPAAPEDKPKGDA